MKALHMRHNNYVTGKLCTYPAKTHQLRTCQVLCICRQLYLFTFSAAETAPEAVWVVRQTQLKQLVVECKQFSEITIVREHKRA